MCTRRKTVDLYNKYCEYTVDEVMVAGMGHKFEVYGLQKWLYRRDLNH